MADEIPAGPDGEKPAATPAVTPTPAVSIAATPTPAIEPAPGAVPAGDKPLGAGGAAPAVTPVWPDDWRERMAGGDKKALKTLERYSDPGAVFTSRQELARRFDAGGLVKVPGKDAKPEEVTAFNKAMGVPEKAEAYLENLQLGEGKVLGEADKPFFAEFAKVAHEKGYRPDQVSAAVNWWQESQEKAAAAQYDQDQTYRAQSERTLKEELGPSFNGSIRAVQSLFVNAPGGTNVDDPTSAMSRLLGGRTTDGKIIGDDPVMNKLLIHAALAGNPAASIVPLGEDASKSISDELNSLRKLSAKQDSEYWEGPNAKKNQARFAELLEVEKRMKSRAA